MAVELCLRGSRRSFRQGSGGVRYRRDLFNGSQSTSARGRLFFTLLDERIFKKLDVFLFYS